MLVPQSLSADYTWVPREWTISLGPDVAERLPGYTRQPVTLDRPGPSMAEWGAILSALEAWEARPGLVQRSLLIRAGGPDTGRYFEKVTFTFDIYSGVQK